MIDVKRRQIWLAATASMVLLMSTGCAISPSVTTPTPTVSPAITWTAEELGDAFADCPAESEVWVSPADSLADTDQWYHAISVDGDRELDKTVPISIVDNAGKSSEARMFGAAWPGIDWALGNGSDVWIATTPDPAGLVQVVMIVTPSGAVFFPGECADKKRAFLQESLGDRTDAVLAELPYLDPSEVHEHLGFPDPNAEQSPSEDSVILNPDDVDASVLEPLELVALEVITTDVVGEGWLTICTSIAAGWNECLRTNDSTVRGEVINAYLDDSRVLTFWLLDDAADVSRPLGRLGEAKITGDHLKVRIDTSGINADGDFAGSDRVTVVD